MTTHIESTSIHHPKGTKIGTMVVGYARAAHSALRAWQNRRTLARTVALMDSRMLADIGLTPNDVGSAFSEPLWRDPTERLAGLAEDRRSAGLQWRDAYKPRPDQGGSPVIAGRVPRVPRDAGHAMQDCCAAA